MIERLEYKLYTSYRRELSPYLSLPYYDTGKAEDYIEYKHNHPVITWEDVITQVNIGLNNSYYTNIKEIIQPDCLKVLVNKYNQLPCDYIPSNLEVIDLRFSEEGLVLKDEVRAAFEAMSRKAWEEGICLKAISTFRSCSYQKKVYYSKLTPEMNMEDYQRERDKVSARPGHSEHQTGLAVDINDLEETFENTPEFRWLITNAYRFGFILRYPKGKETITGYSYEPWHYRYLNKELAEAVYCSNLTYDEFYVRYLANQA